MSEPTDQKELQRLLGMITYPGKFLLNLTIKTAPYVFWRRTLFDKPQSLKMITQSPTLKYLDPKPSNLMNLPKD